MLPEPKLIELVHEQLDIASPTERLKALLGSRWRGCHDALRATRETGDLAAVVGPVAAALGGAPERPGSGRVDLLVPAEDREELTECLLRADAWPDGVEQAPHSSERRERWRAGRGHLTVRSRATAVEDIAALRDRAYPVLLNREDAGRVRVALVEDLLDLVEHSPWPEDALYRAGLRAVLASGRYSSRKARRSHLLLAKEDAGREKDTDALPLIRAELLANGAMQASDVRGPVASLPTEVTPDPRVEQVLGPDPDDAARAVCGITAHS